jgi:hypothetical protein
MAVVRVERLENIGCGCGNSVRAAEVLVEARNSRNARPNDQVYLESNYDRVNYRSTVRTAGSFGVFILGLAAGEFALPRLGLASIPCSIGFGLILALAAFLIITRVFNRNPLGEPEVVKLIHGGA